MFWEKDETKQNEFLIDFFQAQKSMFGIKYFIDCKEVCLKFWRFCYGISSTRYAYVY